MTGKELKDWLENGNCVHCDGLEERETFFQICEDLGFQRGFMPWEYPREFFYMYLSKKRPGQIHGAELRCGDCRKFADLGLSVETFEAQDPMLLYM